MRFIISPFVADTFPSAQLEPAFHRHRGPTRVMLDGIRANAAAAASDHGRVRRSPGALGLARHLLHKETHLPQGVRSTGDEKEGVGTSGLPPAYLVNTVSTGADHVMGVGVFRGAPGRLRDPDASWPWN